jgi:S-adenosylmethionine decarboxylase
MIVGVHELYKGKHLLVDCRYVDRDVCLDDRRFLNAMARAAELAGSTVISQLRYRFGADSPPGFTSIVMLDESHCSAHTYADLGLVALDLFTCGRVDPQQILDHLVAELDLGEMTVRSFERFAVAEQETSKPFSRLAGQRRCSRI